MLGMACPYQKKQHRIIHHRLEKWIKRQVPDSNFRDSLFLYYHNSQGTFVIASWTVPGKFFVDVINLGDSLSNFDYPTAQQFRLRVRAPMSGAQTARTMKQYEQNRLSQIQEENDENVEYNNQRYSEKRIMVSV